MPVDIESTGGELRKKFGRVAVATDDTGTSVFLGRFVLSCTGMKEHRSGSGGIDGSCLQAVNLSKGGGVVAQRVMWARTSAERRRGLLAHSELAPEEGLYISPCEWVHTFRMKFAIDIAFLASDGRVLAMHHALKPNRISKLVIRADGVLELAAGRLHSTNTEVGDVIKLAEVDASIPGTPPC